MGYRIYTGIETDFTPPVREEWMDDAACLGTDPDIFFSTSPDIRAAAKSICNSCPVRLQCLAYTINAEAQGNTRYGISGGLSGNQRKRLAKRIRVLNQQGEYNG